MFSKRFLPGLGFLLLTAILLWAAGCSDEKAPISSTATEGSLTDPEFVMVQTQVDNYLDSSKGYFSTGLNNTVHCPRDTGQVHIDNGPVNPDDTLTYAYLNGWHIIYLYRTNPAFTNYFVDSVQYRNNNDTLQEPSGLDYLHFIRHHTFAINSPVGSYINMTSNINLEFAGLDGDIATVNGTKNFLIHAVVMGVDTSVDATYGMEVAVSDITINKSPVSGWSSGCPASGSAEVAINQSYTITAGDVPTLHMNSWKAYVEFDNGTATVSVVKGSTVWHYTREICTPPVIP